MRRRSIALAMFLLLASCSGKTPSDRNGHDAVQAMVPKPAPVLPSPPPDKHGQRPDLAALPLSPGQWYQKPDGVLFGQDDHEPEFLIECDRSAELVYIAVEGRLSAPGWLHVATMERMKSWDVPPTEDSPLPTVEAAVGIKDPFLGVLAGAKGRIGIRVGGGKWLVMPVGPGIAKTLADCHASKPLPGETSPGDD